MRSCAGGLNRPAAKPTVHRPSKSHPSRSRRVDRWLRHRSRNRRSSNTLARAFSSASSSFNLGHILLLLLSPLVGGGDEGRRGGGSETDLVSDGGSEWETELLDGRDGGFGAEDAFLLLVEGLALGDGVFHLEDAVVLLAEGTEALGYKTEDGSFGDVRGRFVRHCCASDLVGFGRSGGWAAVNSAGVRRRRGGFWGVAREGRGQEGGRG
ncbi:glycine-rich protein [Actinidia rufa]|uniref:Glycine-rich protein n=1 Tax=Actinidia rufa TaxID=165716 RepID=A0A7J0HEN4_9ERIC|nr:glycine-rich protein [Actinidia rufa]